MDTLLHNIRFAFRTLRKNRVFAVFAVLTLGLGIGANTAIFSVIDGVLLKPLPYESGDRLLLVRQSAPLAGRPNAGVSIKELYDYREQMASFDALVEYHQMNFDLLMKGEPDRVNVGVVSHDFFNVLGIRPIFGRTFLAADDAPGADAVLVLSNSYWRKTFGGDPSIVGRVFQMNDRPHTVVGVLPAVPLYPQENDVYMSVSACPFRAAAEKRINQNRRAFAALTVFGRLKPAAPADQATADVRRVADRFTGDNRGVYPAASGFTATTLPVRDELTRGARPLLLILLGTTAFVLLIACSNIANLSLARLLRRERELAVRAALGAGRRQLIAQLLTESIMLSLAGGLVGLFFASSTLSLLTAFIGRFTARTTDIQIDPRVLFFTIAVSFVTGIIFGILPALGTRADLVSSMKQGSKGAGDSPARRRLQSGLIVVQVAVSVVLLVGAGLLLASLFRLQQVDPGYRGERVLSAEAFPNFTKADTLDGLPVAIVNKTMTRYWQKGRPLGSQVSLDSGKTWLTVIGVAADTRQYGLDRDALPQIFVPLSQAGGIGGGRFIVRTQAEPLAFGQALRAAIHAVDPDMPVKNVTTMAELRDQALATPKLTALLLTIFAALALAVTISGISGVIAISVSHRLEEFGLRMALGASPAEVLRLVLRQGVTLALVGIGIGLAASIVVVRALNSVLFEISPWDPLAWIGSAITLLAVSLLASWVPARRALRVDPVVALRG